MKKGILFRLNKLKHYVFDKTGTLTQSKLILKNTIGLKHDSIILTQQELLSHLAALENQIIDENRNPYAKTIISYANQHELNYQSIKVHRATPSNKGIIGEIEAFNIAIGNQAYLEKTCHIQASNFQQAEKILNNHLKNISPSENIHINQIRSDFHASSTLSYVAAKRKHEKNYGLIAFIIFEGPLRDTAKPMINSLQNQGNAIYIATGDTQASADAVARKLNILPHHATGNETEKEKRIIAIRKAYPKDGIAMIGDGVNDANALSAASSSFINDTNHYDDTDLAKTTAGVGIATSHQDCTAGRADIILKNNRIDYIASLNKLPKLVNIFSLINQSFLLSINITSLAIASGIMYFGFGLLFTPTEIGLIAISGIFLSIAFSFISSGMMHWKLSNYFPKIPTCNDSTSANQLHSSNEVSYSSTCSSKSTPVTQETLNDTAYSPAY